MIAAGKKNRLKMKNNNQLCPLRLATRAGQNAMATQMITKMIKPNQLDPDIALTLLLVVAHLSLQRTRRTSVVPFRSSSVLAHCIETGGRLPPPIRLPPRSQRSPWHTGSGISADSRDTTEPTSVNFRAGPWVAQPDRSDRPRCPIPFVVGSPR